VCVCVCVCVCVRARARARVCVRVTRRVRISHHPHVCACACPPGCTPGFLDMFKKNNELLDTIQRCLEDYLASKRAIFARFYFLSNDEVRLQPCCTACSTAGFAVWFTREQFTLSSSDCQPHLQHHRPTPTLPLTTSLLTTLHHPPHYSLHHYCPRHTTHPPLPTLHHPPHHSLHHNCSRHAPAHH